MKWGGFHNAQSCLKSYWQLMVHGLVVEKTFFLVAATGGVNNFSSTHALKSNHNEIHWITTTNNKKTTKTNKKVEGELKDKKR